MKTVKIYIALLLMVCAIPSVAQNDLSESDKEALQARVKDKVDEFQYHLSCIVNTELTDYQRLEEIDASLVLFIGKGERYNVTNDRGEVENHSAVRMQLSSVNNDIKRWLTMKKYLRNQYENVHRYGKVVIQAADAVRVDNINKVSDGHYEAMAYFAQKYIAFSDGRVVYSDITTKKIKVYIDALEVLGEIIWDAKLGDVYVTSTNPNG